MPTRERRSERAAWLIQRDLEEAGRDLREARLGAGLTLRDVARRIGTVASVVLDTERARAPGARPDMLARHAAVVGMRVRIKAYPEGEPIRDAAQLDLMRRFRARLADGAAFEVEVPVTDQPADRRAWDAVLTLPSCRCALEFVTRFHDCQAQLRTYNLKARDGNVDRLVVVVNATNANRRALRAATEVIAGSYPLGTRQIMAALIAGRDPGANGITLL